MKYTKEYVGKIKWMGRKDFTFGYFEVVVLLTDS